MIAPSSFSAASGVSAKAASLSTTKAIATWPFNASAFVVLRDAALADTPEATLKLEGAIMKVVNDQLGAVARPARVHFVGVLPKPRSGKLLRRAIQAVCEGRDAGDLTTIEDPSALQQIKDLMLPRP